MRAVSAARGSYFSLAHCRAGAIILLMRARVALFLLLASLAACGRRQEQEPLDPAEALASFKLSDDFRIELFAAEPDVLDPVDMVFDENGRAFVAEMLDLPYDPPKGQPARSRIRMLEDTDGDGRADRSTIYAGNLLQASGLLPWKGGLIVPAAPDILYLKDTDGDGKADQRKVLFTGFWRGNPEAQVTNPRFAMDNWIYFSNSGNEGLIRSPEHPERPPVQVRGADFRYHPVRDVAEAATGPAQFGSTFDDWGNRIITHNTIHLRHVVLPRHYLARAPLLTVPSAVTDIYHPDFRERRMFPLTKPQRWRVERTRLRQARYDETQPGRMEHVSGYITGAAGGTIYTGDVFPEQYRGAIFTGDVSGNLVRLDFVRPSGVTFVARPHKEGVEFLASTDQWFRPTAFANAPDGLLYLTDMYREFIETPLSIPEELRKEIDFYSGNDRGRIYRIVPNKPLQKRDGRVKLGGASADVLVATLASPNGWRRQAAQRLLVERQDRSAAPLLKEMARKGPRPQSRLQALWTLEGLGSLDQSLLLAALSDPAPQVREHAVRLSESLPHNAAMERALLARAADQEPRVRFQLAFTLGEWKTPAARQALAALAASHASDEWFRAAILSSVAEAPGDFLSTLLAKSAAWQQPDFVRGLASLIGARRQESELSAMLGRLGALKEPRPALAGLAQGLALGGGGKVRLARAEALLSRYLDSTSESERESAWELAAFLDAPGLAERARREALSTALAPARRAAAMRALRGAGLDVAKPVAESIFGSAAPTELQAAAIDTLASLEGEEPGRLILAHWKNYTPEARLRAVAALVGRRDRLPLLVGALEDGDIEASALEVSARNRLLELDDPGLAERASSVLRKSGADRAAVLREYRDAAKTDGDYERGKLLFAEHCSRCHAPRREGGQVGPDLSGVNNKTREELLAAILDPSAAIESRYVNYLVTAKAGRMYDGILAGETPGTITLRGGTGGDVTLLRSDIAEMRASGISLMPEGLERPLTKQQMADVIAYLRAGK